ncbi:MAG: hypothetical protein ACQEVA_04845 [Myxococcota bacterium]
MHTLHRTFVLALAFVASSAMLACGEGETKKQPSIIQFPMEISATDTNGEPVAGAKIIVDGSPVGFTDRDGLFQAALSERKGAEVTVSVEPPDGYKLTKDATTTQTMSLTENVTGEGMTRVPVSLQAQMVSTKENYLLWVDLQCDEDSLDEGQCTDVPVLVGGEEVARTNEQGIAHITLTRVPGSSLKVEVDTPEYEGDDEDEAWKMKPADPDWTLDLGTDAEVLVIEQRFTDPAAAERAKARAKRAARRRAARRRAASRSKNKSKSEEKKKEKDEDGVIQLW